VKKYGGTVNVMEIAVEVSAGKAKSPSTYAQVAQDVVDKIKRIRNSSLPSITRNISRGCRSYHHFYSPYFFLEKGASVFSLWLFIKASFQPNTILRKVCGFQGSHQPITNRNYFGLLRAVRNFLFFLILSTTS